MTGMRFSELGRLLCFYQGVELTLAWMSSFRVVAAMSANIPLLFSYRGTFLLFLSGLLAQQKDGMWA